MLGKKKTPAQSRTKYEDHSQKFLDWVDHLGLEKTFFGRLLSELETRFLLRRSAIVGVFCVIISYLIYFQIRIPHNFVVGEVARIDYISPISFEMVDEVTTEEKKLRAEYNLPVIFDYDPQVLERITQGIYRGFRNMRFISKNSKWPGRHQRGAVEANEFLTHKSEFEKDLGIPVADYLFEWLMDKRFEIKIENALVSNLRAWYEKKIAEAPDRYIPEHQEEVLIRFLNKLGQGREYSYPKNEILDLQNMEPFVLKDKKALQNFTETDKLNLLYLARSLLIPNLTLNKQETATRKQATRESILSVNISIKRNQTIISKGTRVQPFHMAVIKQIEILQSDRRKDLVVFATAALLCLLIAVFASYIRRFTLNKLSVGFKDLLVMMFVSFSSIFLIKVFLFMMEAAFVSKFSAHISNQVVLFAAPVAMAPMIIGLLIPYGELVWLFTAFFSVCLGVMEDFDLAFTLVVLVGGIAAARGVYNCKTRNDIYRAGIRTGLINAFLIIMIFIVLKMDQENSATQILFLSLAGFVGGILSSLLTMTFIPLLESAFHYTTDVKLLELSNLNHPLLKEMIVKAPGTYHHSMLVGSMVEAAAEEIGANPLLGKVMCYYHDIGKVGHANYFIENQRRGQNPHDQISPFMSKTLLIAHVKDGVELGMKYKLGKPIIDGIVQHHGTTLISYFYNKALDLKEESDTDVPENEFRYPGPKPQFREAALCMLADSIEAAARSLDEPTPTRLQSIVQNVVHRKFADGQLDECNLTLRDISRVENAFIRILLGIYHQRIDYPTGSDAKTESATSSNILADESSQSHNNKKDSESNVNSKINAKSKEENS